MAIAYVQSNKGYMTNDGSVAFSSNVAAGALIVVSIHGYSSSLNGAAPITDTRSNTYHEVGDWTVGGDGSLWLNVWYAYNSSAGACTVSVDFTGAGYFSVGIHEFSGALTTDPLDQNDANTATGTGVSGGPITTTQAAEMLFGAMTSMAGALVTIAPDGDYTQMEEYENGSTQMHLNTQYRIVSDILTDTANWTLGSSLGNIGIVVSFKAAAGEPPAGRTTKNTDPYTLGIGAGISRKVSI